MPGEGSLRRGAPARGPPKHQNAFAFKHNKNSKTTKKIQKISHQGLCKRCNDKIEWRKKYRKYKPLTAPGICNGCKQRTVKRAYHTLCDSCAGGRGVCAKCTVKLADQDQARGEEDDDEEMEAEELQLGATSTSKANAPTQTSPPKKEQNKEDEQDEGDEDEDASMEGEEDIEGEEEEDEYDEDEED